MNRWIWNGGTFFLLRLAPEKSHVFMSNKRVCTYCTVCREELIGVSKKNPVMHPHKKGLMVFICQIPFHLSREINQSINQLSSDKGWISSWPFYSFGDLCFVIEISVAKPQGSVRKHLQEDKSSPILPSYHQAKPKSTLVWSDSDLRVSCIAATCWRSDFLFRVFALWFL